MCTKQNCFFHIVDDSVDNPLFFLEYLFDFLIFILFKWTTSFSSQLVHKFSTNKKDFTIFRKSGKLLVIFRRFRYNNRRILRRARLKNRLVHLSTVLIITIKLSFYIYNLKEESRMKFVCDGLTLSEAVMKVSKACAVRTTAPVMECIKIGAEGEAVNLLATDGELSIQKTIKAEVFEEGEICVPGKLFADFIGKLTEEEICVSTGEKGVEIKYRDSGSYIQSISAEEFPKINLEIGENSFVMKQGDLKKIIAETTFCCAQDDSRPVLKGCLMEFRDRLEMTALDGYRLALSEAQILAKSGEQSIICPARTLAEIARMLAGEEEEITIYTQGGLLMVKSEGTVVVSRLYQGEFIKKENVIPSRFATNVTLSRNELIASVERAAILIRGDKNNLVTFDISSDTVKISSVSDYGNVSESVSSQTEGVDLTISMNAKYLLDSLRALEEEQIVLSFNGSISPFILQNVNKKESLYLILPVRNAS